MPQLEIVTFFSQTFWLFFFFSCFYWCVFNWFILPAAVTLKLRVLVFSGKLKSFPAANSNVGELVVRQDSEFPKLFKEIKLVLQRTCFSVFGEHYQKLFFISFTQNCVCSELFKNEQWKNFQGINLIIFLLVSMY